MSDRKLSRGDLIQLVSSPKTAADLIALIATDVTLGSRKKEARRSAIRSLCKGLNQSPETVLVSSLKRALATLTPAQCGVTFRTFENTKAYARRALATTCPHLIDTRKLPVSPEWRAMLDGVPGRHGWKSCGRFARYCTALGISPSLVDEKTADRYAADLGVRLSARNAHTASRSFRKGWNQHAAKYPEVWPQVSFEISDRRKVDALKRHEVNSEFLDDVDRMLSSFGSCLNLPEGFTKPYEETTIAELQRLVIRLYSVAIKYLHLQPFHSLREMVQPNVVECLLAYYLDRFGDDNPKSAHKYAHYLLVIAKYWVASPDSDLKKLQLFRKRTKATQTGMTEKNRAMLRAFEDDRRVADLLTQGEKSRLKFARISRPRAKDALELQSALAMDLLIAAPIRPQNLATIDLTRHIIRTSSGRSEIVHLVFPAKEVKNDVDLEFRLPPRVVKILDTYIEKALPLIADSGNAHLFPGQGSNHKGPGQISKQLANRTLRVLGARVTGHRFRHLVSFLFLRENPGAHEVVRRFLGHKWIETTVTSYAGMEQTAAISHYDSFIERLRNRLAPSKRRAKPSRNSKSDIR